MQTSTLKTIMNTFDRVDAAIFASLITAIVICFITIAYLSGASNEMHRYRKEAIERNFAHYVVSSSGKTEFRWKAPARSQNGADESLVYKISL
jgi:hypothetical protein